MKKRPGNKKLSWRKIPRDEISEAETFLKEREKFCVSASACFLHIGEKNNSGHVWHLRGSNGEISALLLHHKKSLYPVFNSLTNIPGPRFLNRFLGKVHIHALQGIKEDVEALECLMESKAYFAREHIDYDLMSLDEILKSPVLRPCPAGLVIRPPRDSDRESLVKLQSAYEQEEVIPKNGIFDPASSRNNLERILSKEHILLAELDGHVVGKINTSSQSFSRFQIGGVYVRPDCRGRGIAAKMTWVFANELLAKGKGITLFVKKRNAPARAVYLKLGFGILSDYRISYY